MAGSSSRAQKVANRHGQPEGRKQDIAPADCHREPAVLAGGHVAVCGPDGSECSRPAADLRPAPQGNDLRPGDAYAPSCRRGDGQPRQPRPVRHGADGRQPDALHSGARRRHPRWDRQRTRVVRSDAATDLEGGDPTRPTMGPVPLERGFRHLHEPGVDAARSRADPEL